MNNNELNMSFSGLKSAVINLVHNEKQRGNEIRKYDLACSFQTIAIDELIRKTELALQKYNCQKMIVAGGVSANKYLRSKIEALAQKYNVDLTIPPIKYCTDNAAMIGAAGYFAYKLGRRADISLNAKASDELK